VVEDISLNGRVSVSSDTSLNGNLFVSRDISLNGNVNVNSSVSIVNDISVNGMRIGRGFLNRDTSIYVGNLQAIGAEWSTAVGYQSLHLGTNSFNSAIGYQSAYSTNSSQCTALGYRSLYSTTAGSGNSSSGYQAGYNNTTGPNNTYIGYGADASAGTYSTSTAVGANSSISGSNQIVLGRPTETVIIPRILRYSTLPMLVRSAGTAQSFSTSSEAAIDWVTANYTSPYIPISHSTGTFSNTAGTTISVHVTASFGFATASVGTRALWIFHSNSAYSRISFTYINANPSDPTMMQVCGNFTLSSSETFSIRAFQDTGNPQTATGEFNTWQPCRVFVTVY